MADIYLSYCITNLRSDQCPNGQWGLLHVNSQWLTQAIAPPPVTFDNSVNTTRIADMATTFGLFVLALVTVWGIKQVLRLFTGDTDK